ncbi:nucleotide-binding alpha-beta plait domain-containing protein [Tanacetum coccineum]
MGYFRTKEDDVDRISTSVFITNFPDSTSAKDLFKACNQYGHVIDSFIPNKKSKSGKRFGFVKFINVFSEERLINNLCTVWIGTLKMHANIAHFQRPSSKKEGVGVKKTFAYSTPKVQSKPPVVGNSYVGILKGERNKETIVNDSGPSIVLGDDCLMNKVCPNAIFGKVKEFASLANLKVALSNEGFSDIVIKYMGELWVMLEFKVEESLLKFQESISAMSWFSQVVKVTPEFEVEGRIAWVEVEGIPFKLWTSNTFARIAEKWGKLLDVDDEDGNFYHSKTANETPGWVPDFTDEIDNDDINSTDDEDVVQKPVDIEDNSDIEKVPNTFNEEEDLENKCDSGVHSVNNLEKSEDPFNLYSLLNRKDFSNKNANDSDSSLKFPPGFTPPAPNCDDDRSENIEETKDAFTESYANNNLEENNVDADNNCFDKLRASGGSKAASVCSGSFKKSSVPRSGGSFLGLMEEVVKVGQTMGYNMEGCEINLAEIIKSQGASMGYP